MRAADAKRCGTPAPRVRDAGGAGAGAEGCGRRCRRHPCPRDSAGGGPGSLPAPIACSPCGAAQLRTPRTPSYIGPLCRAPPCDAAQHRTRRTPSSLWPLCRAPPRDAAQRRHRTEPPRHALFGIRPDTPDNSPPNVCGTPRRPTWAPTTESSEHALVDLTPDMRDTRRPTQDGRARGANVGESRCAENRSTGAGGRQSAPSSPPEHALVDTAPDIPDNSPPNACGTPRRPT